LQPQERQQALLLEQVPQLVLLALQMGAAVHKPQVQAFLEPYSGSPRHFQTYTIDTH
jgi:hypothetical protein